MANFVTDNLDFGETNATLYSINFDNAYQMIKFIEEAPYVYPWKQSGDLASHLIVESKNTWYGSKNFEEAIELFEKGDSENFENLFSIKDEISNLMPYFSKRRVTEYAPYGIRPNVPRFLTQNPNCMYKLTREKLYNVINIYYNVSSKYGTDNTAIQRRGMITLALIDLLEKMDYRVNLVFFELNKENNEYILIRLNIKEGLQSLDPSICFFPMCHPSFIRRITPAIMEKCSVKEESWRLGYGNPGIAKREIDKIFNLNDKDIYTETLPENVEFGKHSLVKDIEIFLNSIHFNRFLEEGKEMVYNSEEEKFIIRDIPYHEEIVKEASDNEKEKTKSIFQKIKKRF